MDTFHYQIGTTDSDNNVRKVTADSGFIAEAEGNITLQAGGNISIKGSAVRSDSGTVRFLAGQDINLTTGENIVDASYKWRHKNGSIGKHRGSGTSDEENYEEQPISSEIEGNGILFAAQRDINLLSSNSIDRSDTFFKAGRDITSAVDTGLKTTEYTKTFKGSGIRSGGIFGIQIGKWTERHSESTSEETPIPTSITSVNGHVDLDAEGIIHATTTYIYGKDGVTITGSSVMLDGTQAKSTYHQTDAYSFKGLTVGLGGTVYGHLNDAYLFTGDALEAKDKRLSLMEGIEVGSDLGVGHLQSASDFRKYWNKNPSTNITLTLALTNQSSRRTYDSTVIKYEGGAVSSQGDVVIRTTDIKNGEIKLIGETVSGKKVQLETYHLDVESGENNSHSDEDSEAKGGSGGVDIGAGGTVTPGGSAGGSNSHTAEDAISYTPTLIQGDTVEIISGGNTYIQGSIVQGKNVQMDVGGDLSVTSDRNSYTYHNKASSVGMNIGLNQGSASVSEGKTDYTLQTVVEQAGISAGEKGLNIKVKGKTTLTGAVIDSRADKEKNQITTGDLEMKNIENTSSEKDSGDGAGYNQGDTYHNNEKGLIPQLPISGHSDQKSLTYAAIADGKLVITGNRNFDTKDVNRNTQETLNVLPNTLDTQKTAERKKLSELFAKYAFDAVHNLTESFISKPVTI